MTNIEYMDDSLSTTSSYHHVGRKFNFRILIFIGLFIIGLVLGSVFSPWSLISQQNKKPSEFTVTGVGTAELNPNIILIDTRTDGKKFYSPQEAFAYGQKLENDIRDKLKPFNLSERELIIEINNYAVPSQVDVSLPPSSSSSDEGDVLIPTPSPYLEARNVWLNVEISLEGKQYNNAEKIKSVLEGIDYMQDVYDSKSAKFTPDVKSQALEKAIINARKEAEKIAKINNLKIVRVAKTKEIVSPEDENLSFSLTDSISVNENGLAKYTMYYEVVYEMR